MIIVITAIAFFLLICFWVCIFFLVDDERHFDKGHQHGKQIVADRLAQLIECQTNVREVRGSSPDRINTQGL